MFFVLVLPQGMQRVMSQAITLGLCHLTLCSSDLVAPSVSLLLQIKAPGF